MHYSGLRRLFPLLLARQQNHDPCTAMKILDVAVLASTRRLAELCLQCNASSLLATSIEPLMENAQYCLNLLLHGRGCKALLAMHWAMDLAGPLQAEAERDPGPVGVISAAELFLQIRFGHANQPGN